MKQPQKNDEIPQSISKTTNKETVSPKEKSPPIDETIALVAKRPPKGKAGSKVTVLTNSYVIRTPLDQINLYLIEFTPEIPEDATDQRLSAVNSRRIRDKIIAVYGPYFFENKHLLCLRKREGENQFTNEDLSLTVTIKYLKSIDLKDLSPERIEQHEQIIHLMLSKIIRGSDLIRIGANYFEQNEPLFSGTGKFDIRERNCPNIRIWRGYSISCERKLGGIHMNVDTVHRVLHQKSVGEKMEEIFTECGRNEKLARKRIEEMVVNNVVITIHNKRLYRISSIDWSLGIDDTFIKDGKKISYRKYFDDTYKEKCEQKIKGMLIHIPKPRKRKMKNAPQIIVLPPELCHETGMSKKLKSKFTLMRKIADTTRIRPHDRHTLRSKLLKRFQETIGAENNYDTDSQEGSQKGKTGMDSSSSPAREYSMSEGDTITTESQIPMIMSQKPVQVQGRLLPRFRISLADQNRTIRQVDPYTELQSGWNNAKFINKNIIRITHWAVLSEDKRICDLCINQLISVSQKANLLNSYLVPKPTRYIIRSSRGRNRNNTSQWQSMIDQVLSSKIKPQILLCILPDERNGNPTAIYNIIKTICCTQNPVLTQCITTRNVLNQKRASSVFKGCIKQMLTKVGNTPWRANFTLPDKTINLDKPTMICGMDVNHDMMRNCSTVSFVASYTSDYTKYNTFVYHQALGREVMIEGGTVIGQALKQFHSCNKGNLPQNIIIYRDGVSTAQLSVIVLHEVRSYRERFSKIKVNGKPYKPKLSVIVSQKNVSARFIDSKFNSLRPGTVIDSQVVSSKFWDFYLIPCAATNRNTTASPTRFIVAYDEIGFTQDDIAALTNQLCNVYFNIAAAVRVPAPIQYAHKIAHMFGTAIDKKKPCKELIGKPFFL